MGLVELLSNHYFEETKFNFSLAETYNVIVTHGSEAQKAVVRSFFLLVADSTQTPLIPIKYNASYSLVPQTLLHFIPRLPQFIINFFPGLKLRPIFSK